MANSTLHKTCLHDVHLRLNGRMVPFAGYEMPVQYEGIVAETRAVRQRAGIFDVSHMARIFVDGPEARSLLDWVHTADIGERMLVGRARYGLLCNEAGGIIDDGIVYRLNDERFMLIANAANASKVYAWLERWRDQRFADARLQDRTAEVAMIALQGPDAIRGIQAVSDFDPSAVRPFRIADCTVLGKPALVSRTGYTGEDGVEVMPASSEAPAVWDALMERGAVPCGLGARDTLRLEAALPLHGHDIDETTNPVEAGLERFVALDAGDFSGKDAVRKAAEQGVERRLTGFQMLQRGPVPREGSSLLENGATVGRVSSGGYSPTLDMNLGLGYVPPRLAGPDNLLQVDIRGRSLDARTTALPFYSRPR